VVSVPSDSADQKMRVSRYVVMSEVEHRLESRFYQPEFSFDEEDEDEYDEDDYVYEDDFLEEDEDEDVEEEEAEPEKAPELSDSAKFFSSILNQVPNPSMYRADPNAVNFVTHRIASLAPEPEPEEAPEPPVKRDSQGRRGL